MSAPAPARFCLWGAGGHAKVVVDAILASLPGAAIAFVDDNPGRQGDSFDGFRVSAFGPDSLAGAEFAICIGDNIRRAQRYRTACAFGSAAIVIHPSAIVSPSARIGPGTVVLARAVVNAGASIGVNCIVNTGAIVEHDCRVGDHSHVSPGAVLGGGVKTGSFTQIGLGARVLPGVSIGEGTLVGAGSVVIRDVGASLVVAGVPSRVLRAADARPSFSAGSR